MYIFDRSHLEKSLKDSQEQVADLRRRLQEVSALLAGYLFISEYSHIMPSHVYDQGTKSLSCQLYILLSVNHIVYFD